MYLHCPCSNTLANDCAHCTLQRRVKKERRQRDREREREKVYASVCKPEGEGRRKRERVGESASEREAQCKWDLQRMNAWTAAEAFTIVVVFN